MNLSRTLVALLLSGASLTAAAADHVVNVVKFINFTCPICRASEVQDDPIRQATLKTGGQFIYAPMPSEEGSYARERIYYAARAQGRPFESSVRAALYKGAQDNNLPLSDVVQVTEFLKDELGETAVSWEKIKADADGPVAAGALRRAATVAVQSGAQALPSYVLIVDNVPVATLDTTNLSKGTSLLALRDEVISRITQLANSKK